jgi:hypothetical protein
MKKDHAAVRWLAQHAVRAGRARSGAVVEVLGPHGGSAPATALAYAAASASSTSIYVPRRPEQF